MVKIHFLNVGHGDCIIIENFDTGRNTVIDINRSKEMDNSSKKEVYESFRGLTSHFYDTIILESGNISSALLELKGYNIKLTDPIEYLKENNINNIHRFISTHPHMDHISGLKDLYEEIYFRNIWITDHHWEPDKSKFSEKQEIDWEFYKKLKNNEIEDVTRVNPLEGSKIIPDDGLQVLAPNKELLESSNANDLSYVILFKYAGRKIIFGGDAEEKTWKYIYENYDLSNIDILKASHHGRDSGYYQPVVKVMSPKYTIVSVGKKPSTDASNKYRQYCNNVWSTRWKGNIVFTIYNDGKIDYKWEYDR